MRKFIIKNFALDHISVVFGKPINWVRAANWLYPSFLIAGLYSLYNGADFMNPIGIVILIWLVVMIFFGFVYFRIRPVKWHELDTSQKWQYGNAAIFNKTSKKLPFTEEMQKEWFEIKDTWATDIYGNPEKGIQRKYRFYNIGAFIITPLALIITLAVIIWMLSTGNFEVTTINERFF